MVVITRESSGVQRKIMTRTFLCGAALCALAACTTPIPDSGTGVGFDDYASYEARQSRDAALAGGGGQVLAPAAEQGAEVCPDPGIPGHVIPQAQLSSRFEACELRPRLGSLYEG
mgnify:CR=1 FL=1